MFPRRNWNSGPRMRCRSTMIYFILLRRAKNNFVPVCIYIYTDVLRISKTSQAIEDWFRLVSSAAQFCQLRLLQGGSDQRPWERMTDQIRLYNSGILMSGCIRFGWFKHHWKWWLSIKWWLGPSFVAYYDPCCCWCFISWALHSVVGYTQEFVLHNLSFFGFGSTQ